MATCTETKGSSSIIELPCLGRPFKLGMLYDCRNDNLIFGKIALWDENAIKRAKQTDTVSKTAGNTPLAIEIDTLEEKTRHLGISKGLKLSVLPESLVTNIAGSAEYLNDRKKSNSQVRVCLKYEGPSVLTHLDMSKVGVPALKQSIEATHVVTGVYFGADAFLVFDRHDCDKDKYKSFHQKLLNAVETLATNPDLKMEAIMQDKLEAEKYECTVYIDTQPIKRLTSFTEAVQFYRGLPKLLKGKRVAKAVQLHPLNEITGKSTEVKLVREVSESVATEVQQIFEALHECKITCSELQQNPLCSKFSRFQNHIVDFEGKISLFQAKMIGRVTTLLPQIRSGKKDESQLVKDVKQSPFSALSLLDFVTEKQEEIKKLESLMRQMEDIKFTPAGEALENAVEDHNYDTVVCFAFNVIGEQDLQLTNMKRYQQGQTTEPISPQKSWHKDQTVNRRMRQQLNQFKKLARANKGSKQKFIVTDHANEEGQSAAILISRCGSCLETFVPPSEPSQPFAKDSDISHDCIMLSWTPPESGSEHVEHYIVYSSLSDPTLQQWTKHKTSGPETSLKVTGLLNSTSYLFKVQAQCQFRLLSPESEDSDPFTTKEFIIEDSEELQDFEEPQDSEEQPDSESMESKVQQHSEAVTSAADVPTPPTSGHVQPTKPNVLALSNNEVKVEWELKPHDSEDDVESYIVSYQSLIDPQGKWKRKESNSTCIVIGGLDSNSKYVFKVKPLCSQVGLGIDSDISDPVLTESPSRQPGKPKAISKTPNSIQLQWKEPQHSRVECYIVSHQCISDPITTRWKHKVTDDAATNFTVNDLEVNTSYHFKIRPMFSNNIEGKESELSDPITTSEPICKTSPPWSIESAVTHDTIALSWNKPEYFWDKVEFYIVSYRAQNDPETSWRKKSTQDERVQETLEIDGLTPNTNYIFKVRPECQSGIKGIESDESHPITTKPVCRPGKPKPMNVTHNSIEIKWDNPDYGSSYISSYVLLYTLHNPPEKWEKLDTYNTEPKCVVQGLTPKSKYIFKVLPKCIQGASVPSEVSEPIETGAAVCQPGKPYATDVTHNSVTLVWERPEYESDTVQFYIVSYGIRGDEKLLKQRPTTDNNPTLTIPNLKTGKAYCFKVQPICTYQETICKESEFSDPIETKPQAFPPGKPVASAVTHDSVTIKWENPKRYQQNHNQSFTVLYTEANESTEKEWKQKLVEGIATQTTISQLIPNTKYIFKVQLEVEGSESTESDTSEPIMTTSLKICQPGKPRVLNIAESDGSVDVKWNKPQWGHDTVELYFVEYKTTDPSSQWERLFTKGPVEQFTVQALTAGRQYVFKVRPICSKHDPTLKVLESEESDPFQIIVQDCKPSKPTPLEVTHNSISLQWDMNEDSESTISSYTVSYYSEREGGKWKKEYIEGSSCTAVIGDLKPNTQYRFKVLPMSESSSTNCIESDVSDPITTKSLTCQPGKPKVFTVSDSQNSIRVEWDQPQYGQDSIESYIVTVTCYEIGNRSSSQKRSKHFTDGLEEHITVNDLAVNKKYVFKVAPYSSAPNSEFSFRESEESDPFQITVQDCKPSKPIPLEVTHNSISLQWDMNEDSESTISSYTVSYYSEREGGKWKKEYIEGSSSTAVIGNLKPNTQYRFKVLPMSESSSTNCIESDVSDPITTKSLTCQPGKPKVFIVPDSHNSIRVEWSKPQYGRESIEFYSITCYEVGNHSTLQKISKHFTDELKEHLTINDLAVNKKYVVKVAPYSSASNSGYYFVESEESDPFQIRSQPSKPQATQVTNNSVHLKWKMQGSGKDVEFYTVSFRLESDAQDKSKWRQQSTHSADTNFTVTQLRPATSYIFRITSMDKAGHKSHGEESSPIKTTNTSKPGKPTAAKITDATILLTWTNPKVGQDVITSYTILYCQAGKSKHERNWISRSTLQFTNQLELTPLQHNTKYLFKVRPECKPGISECESEISDPIETKATSEPLGVEFTSVTESIIELKWEKPVRGQESIKSYDVYYQEASSNEWKKKNVGSSLNWKVSGLLPLKEYNFKVIPVCSIGTGAESVVVKAKTKQQLCKPGEITVVQKKHTSIKLKWARPKYGNPKSYTCSYRCVAESKWQGNPQKTATEEIEITGLNPYTTYIFRVCPEHEDADIDTEETTSAWIATEKVPVAERLKTKCTVITGGDCTVYKIPIKTLWKGEQANIARYELDFDPPPLHYTSEKVLMLVGATGAGKSTLINGIVNYIFKVEFEDKFRFKLIHDETEKGQTHSQTSSVNAYTIYPVAGSRLDYTLTIIDTPGFGDTRGVEQDNELFGQIKDFFTRNAAGHKGIDHIHGVGFVVKNPEVRLTATQKYISSSILSVFGQDIKDNIFLMVTFADGATPPVLEAVKEAKVPHKEHFKFNNSALYPETGSNDPVTFPMWNMGRQSFERFFKALQNYSPQSLTLTREVLEERERLESYVKTLREKINEGVQEIDKLEQLKETLRRNEKNMDAFKDFKLKVNVTKQRKVDLPRGVYVTNCLTCNRTCHYNCAINSDDQKYWCCVMKPHDPTNARCTVCEIKCPWRQHVNNPYKFEVYTEEVEQTIEELKKYHDKAKSGKLDVEATIKNIEEGIDELHEHVLDLVDNAQKSLARLGEIALKPNPTNNEGYIDLLIEEERRDARTGYEKRIAAYEQLKKRNKLYEKNLKSGIATQEPAATSGNKKTGRWKHFLAWITGD